MSEPNSVSDIKPEAEKSSSNAKRDLIEGREHSEGELANWFHTGTWPVLLAKIPGKGTLQDDTTSKNNNYLLFIQNG